MSKIFQYVTTALMLGKIASLPASTFCCIQYAIAVNKEEERELRNFTVKKK